MLNESSRVKEKKTLPTQRITSMPVTVLPCLCGSRMCWSAQDVLCQQVYFSTSLPSVKHVLRVIDGQIIITHTIHVWVYQPCIWLMFMFVYHFHVDKYTGQISIIPKPELRGFWGGFPY